VKKPDSLILIFFAFLIGPLIWHHNFLELSGVLYSGGGSWGDLALHATYINHFSQLKWPSFESPIYAGQANTYPLMIDLVASFLIRLGFSLRWSMILTSLAPILAFIYIALKFFGVLGLSVRERGLALGLFLVSGGLIFLPNVHWVNTISGLLLPQRGLAVGLAIFCWILYRLYDHRRLEILDVVGVGLLPMFHIHSFLVTLVLGVWLLDKVRDKLLFFFGVMAIASPQLWWQFSNSFHQGFIQYIWWWQAGSELPIWYWLKNWGLFGPVAIISSIRIWRTDRDMFLKLLLPSWVIFLISNFVSFQPNHFDNIKFLIFGYLLLSIGVAKWVGQQFTKNRFVGFFLTAVLTFPGALELKDEYGYHWPIATPDDQMLAKFVKKYTLPSDLILTSDQHNHPVPMLTGRPIVMGYKGWLWTHGINYQGRELDVNNIFSGQKSALQLMKDYQIKYVLVSDFEREKFQINDQFFEDNSFQVISYEGGRLYQFREAAEIN